MTGVLRTAASLSLSGSLVIAAILLLRPLVRGRVSARWQYYVWLVALARLLMPAAPEGSLMGTLFREAPASPAVVESLPGPGPAESGTDLPVSPALPGTETGPDLPDAAQWLATGWLAAALVLLVRKATAYQSYVRCLRAGGRAVDDPAVLDALAALGREAGVRRPVELLICPLAASPVLIGWVRPCIVLPSEDLTEEAFRCTVLHELTHCRRWDGAYKWLVQAAVCLHWFNPLVCLMAREIARDCELACDEAVVLALGEDGRRAYGDTLLRVLETGGKLSGVGASVTLCEDGKLLKERLEAIMKVKRQTKRTAALSLMLAGALLAGATAAGAYTGPAKKQTEPVINSGAKEDIKERVKSAVKEDAKSSANAQEAARAYELENLPRFGRAVAKLTRPEQLAWLETCYDDGYIAFFAQALSAVEDSEIIGAMAERAYQDKQISFFSILAGELDEEELESWLARAEDDRRTNFQMELLDALDRDFEREALEKKLDQEQDAAYAAVGVTREGKDRYYKGELVNIFLDQQGKGYYVLDMNPDGKVNIKIVRDADDGAITGVAYLTAEEKARLSGSGEPDKDQDGGDDWDKDFDWDDGCEGDEIYAVELEKVEGGETVFLNTLQMKEGDQVRLDVAAERGECLSVGFVKPGKTGITCNTVTNYRQEDEELWASGTFTWGGNVEPGTYRLFVRAPEGDLQDVEGAVTICRADRTGRPEQ